MDDFRRFAGRMVIRGAQPLGPLGEDTLSTARLWKTKYALAATKIREYAAGFPGNLRLEDSVSR